MPIPCAVAPSSGTRCSLRPVCKTVDTSEEHKAASRPFSSIIGTVYGEHRGEQLHTGDDVGYYESSINGSNTQGEPGRARRTVLSHLRAWEQLWLWRTKHGSLSRR